MIWQRTCSQNTNTLCSLDLAFPVSIHYWCWEELGLKGSMFVEGTGYTMLSPGRSPKLLLTQRHWEHLRMAVILRQCKQLQVMPRQNRSKEQHEG